MTESDKIQEDLDDEVHCWSQVPRAGSVTVNVSLKFLWKDKTHEKKEIASKVKVHMKTIRRLKIAEDFKSCCRVLLMPQGLVRQMYPVQKHSRLPFLLHPTTPKHFFRPIFLLSIVLYWWRDGGSYKKFEKYKHFVRF